MSTTKSLRQIKDLPSPKGSFLLGHLPQFKADNKHQVLERWVKESGDLFQINFVGKKFVVSADPEMNQEILKLRPEKFSRFFKINEIMEEMGIVGVFNSEGETWKRHRKPTSEALNLKKVNGYYPIIQHKTAQLLQKWNTLTNTPIDIQKELMKYTVDITTAIAFGYQLDTLNDQNDALQQHLEHIFPMINERITAPIPLWRYYKQQKDKDLATALEAIEKVVQRFIDEAKIRLADNPELQEKPTNFLEALICEQEREGHFSDKEIFGNVFTILLAGEDTTSNSLSWALYYLAQYPEVVNKVREEANEVYGLNELPDSYKLLSKLKYANAVAQEAIRLKPVTPNLYMQANEDLIIKDLAIPKNTVIMLQNKVAQTSDQYFTNPDEFVPERWLKNGCPMHDKHSPEMIKAFGGGARFCPGKNLALYEMIVSISSICKQFDFKLAVAPNDVREKFSFTMYPENLSIVFNSASS